MGDESRAEIVAAFRQRRATEVLEDVFGNLLMQVEGAHVGFFSYGYPLLDPRSLGAYSRFVGVGSLPLGCCRLVLLRRDRQIRRQTPGSGDPGRARPAQVLAGKPTTLNRGGIHFKERHK